ncbi:hypothetical protein C8F01DRAFT_1150249, partial [Mycena amicta]
MLVCERRSSLTCLNWRLTSSSLQVHSVKAVVAEALKYNCCVTVKCCVASGLSRYLVHDRLEVIRKHRKSLSRGAGTVVAIFKRLVVGLEAALEHRISLPLLCSKVVLPKLPLAATDSLKIILERGSDPLSRREASLAFESREGPERKRRLLGNYIERIGRDLVVQPPFSSPVLQPLLAAFDVVRIAFLRPRSLVSLVRRLVAVL